MSDSTMDVIDPYASKESAMASLDWCVQTDRHDLIKGILATHFSDCKISELRRECVQVLRQAVTSGKNDALTSLLKHVDDVHITFGDVSSETAYVNINQLLGKAVEQGHVTIVETLLKKGGDVNSRYQGKPLLHLAISLRHDELAKLLVKLGSQIDSVDQRGETPFCTAISRPGKKGDIASWLIQNGADPDRKLRNGKQPIHVSAGHCPSTLKLLAELGSDVNAINDVTGDTPLHVACTRACSESIIHLIQHGARFNVKNINGETPLVKLLNYATNPHDFGTKTRKTLARSLISIGFRMPEEKSANLKTRVGRNKPLDLYRRLVKETGSVLRLQHICRINVREQIQGRHFGDKVSTLEITPHLKPYLQFKPSINDS